MVFSRTLSGFLHNLPYRMLSLAPCIMHVAPCPPKHIHPRKKFLVKNSWYE